MVNATSRSTFSRCLLPAVAIGASISIAPSAHALDQSKLVNGANHAAAHADSTGAGERVGVMEAGISGVGIDLNKYHFVGRLPKDRDFNDCSAHVPPASPCLPPLSMDPALATGAGDHATLVSDIVGGDDNVAPTNNSVHLGVATTTDFYVAHGVNADTCIPFTAAVDWFQRTYGIVAWNNSWGRGLELNDNAAHQCPKFVEWFVRTRDALFVGAAGNNADAPATNPGINRPWDAYNGITVGGLAQESDGNYTTRINWSQYWIGTDNGTALDIRGKPDILAPATSVSSDSVGAARRIEQDGTSMATPHVTGASVLLIDLGLPLGVPATSNHLAHKAIILNAARKRFANLTAAEPTASYDYAGGVQDGWPALARTDEQPSDGDYLTGKVIRMGSNATAPTTKEWTPTEWISADGKLLTVTRPLDDEQGTGVLDVKRVVKQFEGGEQEEKAENPGGITQVGWNREPLSANFGDDIYEFKFAIKEGSFITATLAWDRQIVEEDGDDSVESTDVYNPDAAGLGHLPDFDLYIYYKDALVASSISTTDNVEHLHYPVPEDGDAFEYEIRVDLFGADTTFYNYGLAWRASPRPPSVPSVTSYGLVLLGITVVLAGGGALSSRARKAR